MKVSGAYERVVLGVSEQVPQDRRPGQHYEQVNMISDPVRGLARRHGSLMQDEKVVGNYNAVTHAKWLADTARHRTYTFFVDGTEYDMIVRTAPDSQGLGATAACFAFNKDTRQIVPVVSHADTASLWAGGVSAMVNVGKYVFLAGHTIVPNYVGVDKWNAPSNRARMVLWARGGAYSRTMKCSLIKPDGTKLTVSITTMPSSYQTLLNTSDILSTDPEYQKKVNDRVNAYNAAVTAHIGLAAADIAPTNIATKFYNAFVAAGVPALDMNVQDSTLCFYTSTYNEISCEDGGDGSLLRAVGGEVSTIDQVSIMHWPGKVVKVRPKKNNGEDALYLRAEPKNPTGVAAWAEVTWKEVAGYEMTPSSPFAIATVKSGTLYISGTGTGLQSLTGDPTPQFKPNEVGDDITSPLPYFIGKKIDFLGLFQDRLVIGSGAVLFFSRPGDYFNWFKSSVLSVQDNDPVEMYALGSEDDTIKASTTYDRNMMLFGKRKQYTVNGRQPLTPKSATIVIMSSHEDAVDSEPQTSGNYVFYTKTRNGISSVHQIQMGQLADSPESFNISEQLDRYIQGKPVELVAVTSPNCVLVRTDDARNVLYTYAYLDTATGAERLFDSWSRWEWHEAVGDIVGLGRHEGDILAYVLREGLDKDGVHKVWFAVERFVLDTGIAPRPYADSLRPTPLVLAPTADSFIHVTSTFAEDTWIAFGEGSEHKFLGTDLSNSDLFTEQYEDALTGTWTGLHYDAYVDPTNPYIRDKDGKAIVNGRLTLGRLNVQVTDTGGMTAEVTTSNGTKTVATFSGRLLGRNTNLIGRQPIVTTTVPVPVGKEVRECTYRLKARTFLPLTVTAIEWIGQFFHNARRV